MPPCAAFRRPTARQRRHGQAHAQRARPRARRRLVSQSSTEPTPPQRVPGDSSMILDQFSRDQFGRPQLATAMGRIELTAAASIAGSVSPTRTGSVWPTLDRTRRGLETTTCSSETLTRKGRNSPGSQGLSAHRASPRPYSAHAAGCLIAALERRSLECRRVPSPCLLLPANHAGVWGWPVCCMRGIATGLLMNRENRLFSWGNRDVCVSTVRLRAVSLERWPPSIGRSSSSGEGHLSTWVDPV
jgi:hypothetical protein